ncbi:MAG: hypothetical protein WCG15_05365, partial [Actinomycetes bacterium]
MGRQAIYQTHNVGMAVIERGEAESHEIGRAKVGNYSFSGHGINEGSTIGKTKRHMASALIAFKWRPNGELLRVKVSVDQFNKKGRKAHAFGPEGNHVYSFKNFESGFEGLHTQHVGS